MLVVHLIVHAQRVVYMGRPQRNTIYLQRDRRSVRRRSRGCFLESILHATRKHNMMMVMMVGEVYYYYYILLLQIKW